MPVDSWLTPLSLFLSDYSAPLGGKKLFRGCKCLISLASGGLLDTSLCHSWSRPAASRPRSARPGRTRRVLIPLKRTALKKQKRHLRRIQWVCRNRKNERSSPYSRLSRPARTLAKSRQMCDPFGKGRLLGTHRRNLHGLLFDSRKNG